MAKRRYDSLGNPIDEGGSQPRSGFSWDSENSDEPIGIVVQRAQHQPQTQPQQPQPQQQVTQQVKTPSGSDESLYQELFGKQPPTAAEYLQILKEMPEEKRREAWNKLTPGQRLELKYVSRGERAPEPTIAVSSSYWLWPLLLGFVGGIIAWASVKDKDSKKARDMLISGILWSVMIGALTWLGVLIYVHNTLVATGQP